MRKPLHTDQHLRLRSLLRDRRDAAKLTQQALAELLGVTQSYVAKVEGGERRLDILEFVAVAQAVGADPVELLREVIAGPVAGPQASGELRKRAKPRTKPSRS